jgi:hypothetical protein
MTVDDSTSGSVKESIIKFLSEQPDDVTIEEVMDFLLLKQEIMKGQEALRDGHYYTHEQAKEILERWLK